MAQQLILDLLTAPAPTFENFVVGRNAEAMHALQHCEAGHAIYLWGPPGVGRTHLLRADCHSAGVMYYSVDMPYASALLEIATRETVGVQLIGIDVVRALTIEGQAALVALYNRGRESSSTSIALSIVLE